MRKEYNDRQHAPLREPYASEPEPQGVRHEWKISKTGPPWEVIDWAGKHHTYDTEDEARAFIERDMRLFGLYAADAHADVTDQITRALENQSGVESTHGEQAANARREVEASREVVGGQGNRRSRRRAGRAANRQKASR